MKDYGLSLGSTQILIDKEGSLFSSSTDDLSGKKYWSKMATTSNQVLQNLVLGKPCQYVSQIDLDGKIPGDSNPISIHHNNSILDDQLGLLLPGEATKEASSIAYNYISNNDENSYMLMTKTNLKVPQALVSINLIRLIEIIYSGMDIWGLYGANPNESSEYLLSDKLQIMKSLVSSVKLISSQKSSTGSSFMHLVDSKNKTYTNTSTQQSTPSDYKNLSLEASQEALLNSIDDKGNMWFNLHGDPSNGVNVSELQVNYLRFYVTTEVSMKDSYVTRASLDKTLRDLDRPSITMGNSDQDVSEEGDLYISYSGYKNPLYGLVLNNLGTNNDYIIGHSTEVDNYDGRFNENLSRVLETKGTNDQTYLDPDYRLLFKESN